MISLKLNNFMLIHGKMFYIIIALYFLFMAAVYAESSYLIHKFKGKNTLNNRTNIVGSKDPAPEGDDDKKTRWGLLKKWFSKNGWPFFLGALTATTIIVVGYIIYSQGGNPPPGEKEVSTLMGNLQNVPDLGKELNKPSQKLTTGVGVDEDSWEGLYAKTYMQVGIKPQKSETVLNAYFGLMEEILRLCNHTDVNIKEFKEEWEVVSNVVNWLNESKNDASTYYMRLSNNYYLELKSNRVRGLIEKLIECDEISEEAKNLLNSYHSIVVPVV